VGTNGFAIASLVLGILWVYWVGSILALVFGFVALSQIKQRGEGGRGLAIAGIVLGAVEVVVIPVILVLGFAFVSHVETHVENACISFSPPPGTTTTVDCGP
jgi:hypothetical protein